MNAKVTISHVQALRSSTTVPPSNQLTLNREARSSQNLNADHLHIRATKMTTVLQNILNHSCYTHGGLNE